MSEVLTFGELMLRLTTPHFQRFGQASQFEIGFGGAEANVAVAIAQLGGSAGFVSKLPVNELGGRALGELRGLGVDVSRVVRGGERMGVYFLEQGAGQRAGKVIYDRAHSALAAAQPGDFDWERILEGAGWLHWSGITAALSDTAAAITREACAAARRLGLTVSFDVNYRSKLWSAEKARSVLTPMMEHVDLCVSSVEEVSAIFGIEAGESKEREIVAAQRMRERFGFKTVALTLREASTASRTRWAAMLQSGEQAFFSRSHEVEIVDRLGSGR